MKKYGFGVDIGGTTCKIGLFETSGKMLDKWEIPTNKADNGGHILDDVAASIDEKMKSASIAKEDVEGIGVGVPGPVLEDGSVSVCVNLGWGQVQVADELSSKTGLPVKVGNDANVAALGEMWQGGGKVTPESLWLHLEPVLAAESFTMAKLFREQTEQAAKLDILPSIQRKRYLRMWQTWLLRAVRISYRNRPHGEETSG